jgi:sulfonate transport system substrate-binding protein
VAISSLGDADRVVSRPEFPSIAALRGRPIGVPAGTSGEMILRLALRQHGLDLSNVRRVPVDPGDMVAAFHEGRIDGAGIWNPWVQSLSDEVPGLQVLAANQDFYPRLTFMSAYVGRNEVVRDDPGLVRKVVALLRAATDLRAGDIALAVGATSLLLRDVPLARLRDDCASVRLPTSAQIAAFGADGTVRRWLSGLNELFVGMGRMSRTVDPDTYYDAAAYAG